MQWKLIPPTPLLALRREKTEGRKDCASSVVNMDISPRIALSHCQLPDLTQSTPRLAPEEVLNHRQPTTLPIALGVAAATAEEAYKKTHPRDKSLPRTCLTPDLC
jgi:hypothetical protein